MVEVFTIGGGEYVVNVFNAVAAWTGDGGYKGLIRVAMIMGFAMALISVAFNADWRAWMNWFLQATLIYMCLMVPRLDVQVVDRTNPALAPATVADVPLGLAALASFTSQIGDYLVSSSELVFGLPGDLDYSRNGMIYASRLFEATQSLSIADPEFSTNVDEHFRMCVFYDVLLGRKSMQALAQSDDLWAAIGPGSVARSQRYLTRSGSMVTSEIIACEAAYTRLSAAWATMINQQTNLFGKQLYPKLSSVLAQAKLVANLPVAYQYLTGVSKTSQEIMRQQLLINAMQQSMHTMQGASGASSVDVYAQTRAEIQTRNTYNAIAHNAMKWVPILNIVLTVLFYALFPVLFPLFLLPRGGPVALKGYATGFFYLAAWGPLYVVLHMIMNYKAASEIAAAGWYSNGLSLASSSGIAAVNGDIGTLAGYLIASVPFLAAGVARGAMSIAGQATSYLNPSQNAAEEAARETTTGNIALGNTSLDNFSFNSRQGNAWSTVPNLMQGAPSMTNRLGDGSLATSYPGSQVLDTRGAISSFEFTPQLNSEYQRSFMTNASTSRTRGESLSNQASESFSTSNQRATELSRRLSSGTTLDNAFGSSEQATIGRSLSELEQASKTVQERFGLDRTAADNLVLERFQSGTFSARASADARLGTPGGKLGPLSGGVGIGGGYEGTRGASDRNNASEGESATSGLSSAQDFVEQIATTNNWSSQRESFNRAVETSSSSDIRNLGQSVTSSYTHASGLDRQARSSFEEAQRFEEAASLTDRDGVSVSYNLSNQFAKFVEREQASIPWERHDWKPFRDGLAETPEQSREQAYWIDRFVRKHEEEIRQGVEPKLEDVGPAQIMRPTISTQAGIRSAATADAASIAEGYGGGGGVQRPRSLLDGEVGQRQAERDQQLDRVEAERKQRAEGLERDPDNTLGRKTSLREQDNRSTDFTRPLRQRF